MRGIPTAILRGCFPALCRASAVRQVLGIMTVIGVLAWIRPADAGAQAIGTMQVEARVTGADSEWSSLRTAQQVAGDLSASASSPIGPFRLALPLSEIHWISLSTIGVSDRRAALISIQYLRN
jgi:hypothetical protein